MQAYKGKFKKQNGAIREMLFAHLDDLPDQFLDQKIVGSGAAKNYAPGMQLVWDLEADDFRIFNWSTLEGQVQEVAFDPKHFS